MKPAVGAGVLAGVLVAATGCGRETEYAGVGPWHVKKTTLADATGRCEPTDLPDGRKGTWCYAQPGLRLGDHAASVDLYFGGTTPDAKVIEIQLGFRGCRDDVLATWVTRTFGEPYEQVGSRRLMKNSAAFVVADLPASPGRCVVRLLPRSEAAEVERLKAAADG